MVTVAVVMTVEKMVAVRRSCAGDDDNGSDGNGGGTSGSCIGIECGNDSGNVSSTKQRKPSRHCLNYPFGVTPSRLTIKHNSAIASHGLVRSLATYNLSRAPTD